jgi:hypothetical protein
MLGLHGIRFRSNLPIPNLPKFKEGGDDEVDAVKRQETFTENPGLKWVAKTAVGCGAEACSGKA